ncbi:hypothetical protein ABZ666_20910 [Streptomyces sp. NPDC007056]|uniref:hypothetical protein n=2 Tax=unclassified Streptomyces TaxID=2593676 RepID=UPI0033D47DF7
MSHASATTVTPHSARITEAASAHPLLVVETLDHSAGSTLLFTYGKEAASAGSTEFTYCVQTAPTDTIEFTYCVQTAPTDTTHFTYCVQTAPTDTTHFTYCVQTAPHHGSGAQTTPPTGVEGDAVMEVWI